MGNERIELEKISLKALFGMLSVGQLWQVMGAVIIVIVGAYGFGVWVTEKFPTELASQELSRLEKKNKQLWQQMKFLELTHSYLNARVKNKEDFLNTDDDEDVNTARTLLANRLKEMYKGGDTHLQRAEGYEIDESEANNHKIRFGDGRWWRIPRDVKVDFLRRLN